VENKDQLKFVDDYTVEGAKILMDKVGYTIDAKINKLSQEKGSTKDSVKKQEEAGKSPAEIAKLKEKNMKKQEKAKATVKSFNDIYGRFDNLMSAENQEVSNRVKMLIKNMKDHRDDGWKKTLQKIDEGPKKVAELRKQEMAKNAQKQQESMEE